MLAEAHIVAAKSHIEDCHRLCKNDSTTVQFVNRKFFNEILKKKLTYTKILTSLNLAFLMTIKFMLVETNIINSLQPTSCLEV